MSFFDYSPEDAAACDSGSFLSTEVVYPKDAMFVQNLETDVISYNVAHIECHIFVFEDHVQIYDMVYWPFYLSST